MYPCICMGLQAIIYTSFDTTFIENIKNCLKINYFIIFSLNISKNSF